MVASAAWCLLAGRELSATFDEPIYLREGLARWHSGSYAGILDHGTMPLPVDVVTLPLYLWERWRGVPFDVNADMGLVLPVARAGTLLFWALLLAYGWRIGRQLAGPWGGRLAAALLAAEPVLLGHAALATTDIAVTACLLAFAHHFERGRTGEWRQRVGWPAVWFGIALLAKASTLALGPLVMAAIEIERLRRGELGNEEMRKWGNGSGRSISSFPHFLISSPAVRSFLRDAAQIGGIGLGIALLYCGCDWRADPSFVEWAQSLPAGAARGVMLWTAEHLRIFSNAGEGLAYQVNHAAHGRHGVFLFGTATQGSLWYYFPAVLLVKLSLPLLGLGALVVAARREAPRNWALAAAGVLLVASLGFRLQIGIRLILPLVVLGTVGLAAAAVNALGNPGTATWKRRLLAAALPAGVLWTAAASARVWPHGMAYVNEAWGGTANGYQVVSDSNYDWGQGLIELARWQRARDMAPLDIWYFGMDPRALRLPMRRLLLHALPSASGEEIARGCAGRYVAVGTSFLYGPAFTPSHVQAARYFRSLRPVDRTTTFLIYDFTRPQAASGE